MKTIIYFVVRIIIQIYPGKNNIVIFCANIKNFSNIIYAYLLFFIVYSRGMIGFYFVVFCIFSRILFFNSNFNIFYILTNITLLTFLCSFTTNAPITILLLEILLTYSVKSRFMKEKKLNSESFHCN